MYIKKVKFKDGECIIMYDEKPIVSDSSKKVEYKISLSKIHKDFQDVMESLSPFLQDFCEMDDGIYEVKGVSIDYQENKDGNYIGVVLSGNKALSFSDCPLNLNSPRKTNKQSDVDQGVGFRSNFNNLVETFIKEAKLCMQGKVNDDNLDLFTNEKSVSMEINHTKKDDVMHRINILTIMYRQPHLSDFFQNEDNKMYFTADGKINLYLYKDYFDGEFLKKIIKLKKQCFDALTNDDLRNDLLKKGIPDTFLCGAKGQINFAQFLYHIYSEKQENLQKIFDSIASDYQGLLPMLSETSFNILKEAYIKNLNFNDDIVILGIFLDMVKANLHRKKESIE